MGNLKPSLSLSSAALQYSFCCVLGSSLYTHEAAILDLEGRHWIDKRLSYNALTVTGCMEAGLPNIRRFNAHGLFSSLATEEMSGASTVTAQDESYL